MVATPKPPADFDLVMFAGHRIDEPGRDIPRFPSDREERARALIRDQLQRVMHAGTTTVVLHRLRPVRTSYAMNCAMNLGLTARCACRCRVAITRARFLVRVTIGARGISRCPRRLVPSSSSAISRGCHTGLKGPASTRGTRQPLGVQMARTSGATKVTLLALWDRKPSGGGPGGTAHMVEMARNAGDVESSSSGRAIAHVRGGWRSQAQPRGRQS